MELKNKPGAIYHLCLGVFEKSDPKHIVGWCGLDGTAAPGQVGGDHGSEQKCA